MMRQCRASCGNADRASCGNAARTPCGNAARNPCGNAAYVRSRQNTKLKYQQTACSFSFLYASRSLVTMMPRSITALQSCTQQKVTALPHYPKHPRCTHTPTRMKFAGDAQYLRRNIFFVCKVRLFQPSFSFQPCLLSTSSIREFDCHCRPWPRLTAAAHDLLARRLPANHGLVLPHLRRITLTLLFFFFAAPFDTCAAALLVAVVFFFLAPLLARFFLAGIASTSSSSSLVPQVSVSRFFFLLSMAAATAAMSSLVSLAGSASAFGCNVGSPGGAVHPAGCAFAIANMCPGVVTAGRTFAICSCAAGVGA